MSATKKEINYPPAKRDESSVVTLHDQKVPDYYVCLEKDKNFLEEQTKYANKILKEGKCREEMMKKLKTTAKFERRNLIYKVGNSYFYTANSGTQKYDILYRTENLEQKTKAEIIFNLNEIKESEGMSFNSWRVSPDGSNVALCVSEKCKESIIITRIKCKKQNRFELVKDLQRPVNVAWFEDGIFYSTSNMMKYHKLGTNSENDETIFKVNQENAVIKLTPIVSDDQKYLFISIESSEYIGNMISFARPKKNKTKCYQMVIENDKFFKYITNINEFAYFLTSKKAATNRVIRINMYNRKPLCHCEWAEVISRDKIDVLVDAIFAGGEYLILSYMREGTAFIRIHSLKTGKTTYQIDHSVGTITMDRLYNPKDTEFFYMFESIHIPPIIYRINIAEIVKCRKPPVIAFQSCPENYNPKDYFLDCAAFKSCDKRKHIPMYVAGKITSRNKPRVCILKVRGGFGKFFRPKFCVCTFAFFQIFCGFIAIVFVRGGGEKGRKWHNSGRLLKKIKSMKDYQTAAEHLFHGKYTTKCLLVAEGVCNGALIVASSIVKKPHLFALALMVNPLTDMVKFKRSNLLITEYGDIKCKKKEFLNVLKYSPLHNIRKPTKKEEGHPASLIFCNTKDRNFQFWHSTKFAAALQYCEKNSKCCKTTLVKKIKYPEYIWPDFCSHLDFYADQFTMIAKYVKYK